MKEVGARVTKQDKVKIRRKKHRIVFPDQVFYSNYLALFVYFVPAIRLFAAQEGITSCQTWSMRKKEKTLIAQEHRAKR